MILADDVGEALRRSRSASGCGTSFSNRVLIGEGVDLILTAVRVI